MSQFGGLRSIATNGKTLGEEADLEALTFSLAQMKIGSTNVQFSTKPAFLPNVLRLGGRFNAAKPLLYEVPTYLR